MTLVWRSLTYAAQDYLVELSLLDEAGLVHSLWLGHPVNGHYPTRAWEPGDVVWDTIWLPLRNLEAGDYRIQLRLRSAFDLAYLPPTDADGFFLPTLYSLTTTHHSQHSVLDPYIVWHNGQPATGMPTYRYRATIPITLINSQAEAFLVSPEGTERASVTRTDNTHIFLVGADWTSGEYRLRVRGAGERVESEPILSVEVRPRSFYVPPMSSEVRANFGDEIMLLGYDFPERRVEPGGALPITLYWQAQRPTNRHYIISNHILNRTDLRQWGGEDRVPHYYYSTMLWAAGEVVRDEYLVPVDQSAPPGIYFLDIGSYFELVGQRWHLPLVQDGKVLDTNSVSIGPIKVGGAPPGTTVENPSPQHPRADNLAGLVTLLGYDISLESEGLRLTLYWRCDARLSEDYTTFVHVRDKTGEVTGESGTNVAQMDRPPAEGAYPTSLWEPGEVIRDSVLVPTPSEVPPGEYEIVVGLYNFATGERLPVLDEGGAPSGDYVPLDKKIEIR